MYVEYLVFLLKNWFVMILVLVNWGRLVGVSLMLCMGLGFFQRYVVDWEQIDLVMEQWKCVEENM